MPADLELPRRGSAGAVGGSELSPPIIVYTAPAPAYLVSCENAGQAVIGVGQVLDIRLVFSGRVHAGPTYAAALEAGTLANWGRDDDSYDALYDDDASDSTSSRRLARASSGTRAPQARSASSRPTRT